MYDEHRQDLIAATKLFIRMEGGPPVGGLEEWRSRLHKFQAEWRQAGEMIEAAEEQDLCLGSEHGILGQLRLGNDRETVGGTGS